MSKQRETSGKSVVVVGAGGNIGSHVVTHLARMPQVSRVTLIDKDRYESSNLQTQDITARDVGKRKAVVQARRLRLIDGRVQVEAIAAPVEHVPLGKLRADMILCCLDSRIARQHVNQFAWRLGVPFIDAGVDAGGLLARVNVYVPATDNPCLECAWDERDYEALEQTYPCAGSVANVAPTNAPSSLGALAAALQAIECQKILGTRFENALVSKQVLIDALHHKHYVTGFRRNPNCRFEGHEIWNIEKLDRSTENMTLKQALRLFPAAMNGNGPVGLRVEGKPFVKRLRCVGCARTRSMLRLQHSLRDRQTMCGTCGRRMIATGFDLLERLSVEAAPRSALNRSLRTFGLRAGDVFSVGDSHIEFHYEIAG
jgi:molybdopterin/thiamine biosynthesis adenylyltransferase